MEDTTSFKLPYRGPGAKSKAAEERYEAELDAFCEMIREIRSRLEFDVSSRGWCYILEEVAGLAKGNFDRAQDLIVKCRKSGKLPLDIVAEDSAREFEGLEELDDTTPAEEAEAVLNYVQEAYQYYTPSSFWEDQDYYLELLVEKVDLKSLFAGICKEFYIPFANARGWSDLNSRAHMMRRFKAWEAKGKRPVLLYCGDFDVVGLMISDILRDNMAELSHIVDWSPDNLIINRFGLNYDFIQRQRLTWIEGLATGSGKDLAKSDHPDHHKKHVQDYISQYGAQKVEANALVVRPEAGRALLRETILRYLPADAPTRYEATLRPHREQVRVEVRRLLANL
jgi:hypothetical protein